MIVYDPYWIMEAEIHSADEQTNMWYKNNTFSYICLHQGTNI